MLNSAQIRKTSFLQHLGSDVRSRREDKVVLRQLWEREREGAVTGIRQPGIGSRSHHQLVITHFLGLENYFIVFYIPSTI